jgi:hypothetical protein
MAFVTTTDNSSLSFELFLFNLTTFLIRTSENVLCPYLALVKKGNVPALVLGWTVDIVVISWTLIFGEDGIIAQPEGSCALTEDPDETAEMCCCQ